MLLRQAGFSFHHWRPNLEHQQNLGDRKIAIVVLTRNNWPLVRPHTVEIAAAVGSATIGSHRTVECSPQSSR